VRRADAQAASVAEDVRDRRGHVLGRSAATLADPVAQHDGVVPLTADLERVREALVDRADVREPAARRDQREGRAGPAAKEEEAGARLCRIVLLLGRRVELVKERTCSTQLRAQDI